MWADQHDLSGMGQEDATVVRPTTQEQVFNTINLVAQGLLNERIAKQNVALTEVQAKAVADQAKAQATNYVMDALKKGQAVLLPKEMLPGASKVQTPSWAKWGGGVLIAAGVAALAYAAYAYTRKPKTKSASVVPGVPQEVKPSIIGVPQEVKPSIMAGVPVTANPKKRRRRR